MEAVALLGHSLDPDHLIATMPSDPNIGEREREILTAIVETFIATGEPVGSRTLARSNREGLSPATHSQCDGGSGGRGIPGAAAYFGGPRAQHRSLSLLRRAIYRQGAARAPGREHDSGLAARRHRRAGIHGAHLACALADLAQRGSHGGLRRDQERAGARLLFAAGRSESFGGAGDAVGPGARPGAAAGSSASRSGCWRRASSTRIFAAGPWRRCAPSWRGGWSRNAANTTG